MLKIHEIEDQVRNFINEKIDDVTYLIVNFDTIVEPGYTEITYVVTVKTRYPLRTLRTLLSLEEEGLLEGDEFERILTFQLTEDGVDTIHSKWNEWGWFSWKIDFEHCYVVLEIDG